MIQPVVMNRSSIYGRARRLMIIEPPFYRLYKPTYSLDKYPLALGYLAGAVTQHTDWKVQCYNADFSPHSEPMKITYLTHEGFEHYLRCLNNLDAPIWDNIRQAIRQFQPSVIGLTAKTQNFSSACNIAKIAKQINPNVLIILGGPHASMAPDQALNDCQQIDVAVKGEGEETLLALLNAINRQEYLAGIPGTVIRKKDATRLGARPRTDGSLSVLQPVDSPLNQSGLFIDGGPRQYMLDLDKAPFPHESAPTCLKDHERYPLEAFQYVFATRACPFNCFFCGSRNIWGRNTRWRSAQSVGREFAALRKLGLKHIHFDDDTFGVKRQYILELCEQIQRHAPGMSWSCELHTKLCTEKTIPAMAKAGCSGVQVGIESGSNWMLKEMRKNTRIEESLAACKLIKRHGIHLSTFFIIGFPQETEDTLAQTVQAMKEVHADRLIYSIFTPYPGTETFSDCQRRGLIKEDFDVSRFNHQSPDNCFTQFIKPRRFRELAHDIEKMVDRRNAIMRLKRAMTVNAVKRIKRIGSRLRGVGPALTSHADLTPKVMVLETDSGGQPGRWKVKRTPRSKEPTTPTPNIPTQTSG